MDVSTLSKSFLDIGSTDCISLIVSLPPNSGNVRVVVVDGAGHRKDILAIFRDAFLDDQRDCRLERFRATYQALAYSPQHPHVAVRDRIRLRFLLRQGETFLVGDLDDIRDTRCHAWAPSNEDSRRSRLNGSSITLETSACISV